MIFNRVFLFILPENHCRANYVSLKRISRKNFCFSLIPELEKIKVLCSFNWKKYFLKNKINITKHIFILKVSAKFHCKKKLSTLHYFLQVSSTNLEAWNKSILGNALTWSYCFFELRSYLSKTALMRNKSLSLKQTSNAVVYQKGVFSEKVKVTICDNFHS